MYTLQERAELSPETIGKNPLTTISKFHSQFELNLNQYRDNNNYIRINQAEVSDNRWAIFASPNKHVFTDLQILPPWLG